MDNIIQFIYGTVSGFTAETIIRLYLLFALMELLTSLAYAAFKGAKE